MTSTELLFTVDENNNPIDPMPRSEAHRDKQWHRTVGVWITDGQGKVLCEKRSMTKDTRPGCYLPYIGEHLGPGEDGETGAVRAIGEELSYTIELSDLIAYDQFQKSDKPNHKEFQQIFALKLESPPDSFDFDREEMDSVSWVAIDKLRPILADSTRDDWVHKPWDQKILDWIEKL